MLQYGHGPKMFFVKDDAVFEAVFDAGIEDVIVELRNQMKPAFTAKRVFADSGDLEGERI